MTPVNIGNYIGLIVGVTGATLVSFLISAVILRRDKSASGDKLAESEAKMKSMKAEAKGQQNVAAAKDVMSAAKGIKQIIFACDASMGSSAMGASILRDKVKKAGLDLSVTNTAISNLQDQPGLLVVTQEELADRGKDKTPDAAHIAVDNFLNSPKYDEIIASLQARDVANNHQALDVIACENMIGGSQSLKKSVYEHLDDAGKTVADTYVGFPNAAVDRIVPQQKHGDPLAVSVEDFKEWVVDESQMKNKDLKLKTVDYVPDLEPYIERKLFSVNTGHATTAYTGKYLGYTTIGDAIKDPKVFNQAKGALAETRSLLL